MEDFDEEDRIQEILDLEDLDLEDLDQEGRIQEGRIQGDLDLEDLDLEGPALGPLVRSEAVQASAFLEAVSSALHLPVRPSSFASGLLQQIQRVYPTTEPNDRKCHAWRIISRLSKITIWLIIHSVPAPDRSSRGAVAPSIVTQAKHYTISACVAIKI